MNPLLENVLGGWMALSLYGLFWSVGAGAIMLSDRWDDRKKQREAWLKEARTECEEKP